jgi:hypothetical protein
VHASETRFGPHPHPIGPPSAIKASNADDADDCWSDEVVSITSNLSTTEPMRKILEGLNCESPWRRRTPGALCCRSGSPPIPAETHQRYSKRSPLTVLFRLQVQKYFLARLWLILADPMVSAIQQFLGSSQWAGGINRSENADANGCAKNSATHREERVEAARVGGIGAASALTTGGCWGCLWLSPRIAHHTLHGKVETPVSF